METDYRPMPMRGKPQMFTKKLRRGCGEPAGVVSKHPRVYGAAARTIMVLYALGKLALALHSA